METTLNPRHPKNIVVHLDILECYLGYPGKWAKLGRSHKSYDFQSPPHSFPPCNQPASITYTVLGCMGALVTVRDSSNNLLFD